MNPKRKTPKGHSSRGRRRFNSKFAPSHQPRPYGEDWPVIKYNNRRALLKFFLPVIEKLPPDSPLKVAPAVPMNFAQVADKMLGEKQMTQCNTALARKLDEIERRNSTPGRHPFWNEPEIPTELLREALSRCAKFALKRPIIQRALARLYAVAWFGRASESVAAKRELEGLIPSGRANPITKWIPELVKQFRVMRGLIQGSNSLMKQEFPREIRVKKLAELYDEPTGVISAALRLAETPFLTERLSEVLGIPEETIRKKLREPPVP